MTPDELVKYIDDTGVKVLLLQKKIVTAARAVIPVLLDAQRSNSAKELQELFFELDALNDGLMKSLDENPAATVEAFVRKMREKGQR